MSTDQLNTQKSDRRKESSPCMLCAVRVRTHSHLLCSMRSLKNWEKTKTTEEVIHSLLLWLLLLLLLLFSFVFFVRFWVFFIRTFWMMFLFLPLYHTHSSHRQVIIKLHSIDLPATNLLILLSSLSMLGFTLRSLTLWLSLYMLCKLRPISIQRTRITEQTREGAKERKRFGRKGIEQQ